MNQELPRVQFSTNERAAINRYGLWLAASLRDLEKLGDELVNGTLVIIYEPGELEMEAVVNFDADWNAWIATGDEATIRYYPGAFGETA